VNWTLLTIITLTLADPFNIGLACGNNLGTTQADFTKVQVQEGKQPTRVEGTLEPGGTFVGVDGVTVSSPLGLGKSIDIFVEKIEDPTYEYPLSTGFITPKTIDDVVGGFYRVGVTDPDYGISGKGGNFKLSFPVPEGYNDDNAYVIFLYREGAGPTKNGSDRLVWFSGGSITPDLPNTLRIQIARLLPEGMVFAIVKAKPQPEQSQNSPASINTLQRDGLA